MTNGELSAVFGWSTAVVPGIFAAYSAYRGVKQTTAVALILMCLALAAQYFRTKASDDLLVNRWEPLTNSEQLRLKSEFNRITPPAGIFYVLCPMAGCADLAESLMSVFPLPNWKTSAGTAYWDGVPSGIQLWGHDQSEVSAVAGAIARATNNRLRVSEHIIASGAKDQMNLLIGRKPH